MKDDDLIFQTALAIDALLKAESLTQQTIKQLYDSLIDKIRTTNKRETDEQLIDLAFCCFEVLDLGDDLTTYVTQA